MALERYANEIAELELLTNSITDDYTLHLDGLHKEVIEKIAKMKILSDSVSTFNKKCEDITDEMGEDLETLQDRLENLKNRINDVSGENSQLGKSLEQLLKNTEERKNMLERMKLLGKSCRALTGVDFNISEHKIMGYIFHEKKNILKPFGIQNDEDADGQTEKLWEMLNDIFI